MSARAAVAGVGNLPGPGAAAAASDQTTPEDARSYVDAGAPVGQLHASENPETEAPEAAAEAGSDVGVDS